MTAAIFGLIVIVGTVLTQLRERAKERAETRAIARVVSHELLRCLTPVAAADRHGEAYMLKDLPSGECRDHRLDMARLLTKPGDWESVSNAYEALGMTKTFATTNAAVKRDFTPPEQGCSTARSGSPRSPTGCSSVTPRRGPSDEPTASTWTRCSTGWCRRAILDEAGGSPRGSALAQRRRPSKGPTMRR